MCQGMLSCPQNTEEARLQTHQRLESWKMDPSGCTRSEVGGCLSLRAQPGNRFVSFVRGGARREIIGLLGTVRPWTVPAAPAAPARSRERLAWLLAFGFWLLASFFFFFSFLLFLLCTCALGFWLLCARALGFWLFASVLLLLRACALGFWLLAFGLWL